MDPRYPAALAEGYAAWDADRLAGHMVPVDRDGFAHAYALIATALPEGWSTRTVAGVKPRRLAPVRPCMVSPSPEEMTERVFQTAGGR